MTRAGSFDGEIGRGRQRSEDDSSSRESSLAPRRGPKRSFSPPTDDGDVVVQNDQNDNKDKSPPPIERPIIRQAVAFSDQSGQVPVMTYEAKVVQPKKSHFLPGQEVPLPPKQKTSKRNKKGKKPEAYSGQTSRFRLETYDPTPPTAPPTTHGNGPYSSLYRTVGPALRRKSALQEPQPGPSNGVSMGGSTSVSNTGSFLANSSSAYLPSRRSNDGSNTPSKIPLLRTVDVQQKQKLSTIDDPTTLSLNSQSQSQMRRAPSPLSRPMSVDGHSHSTFVTDTSLTRREHSPPGPYYRRDYDDKDFLLPRDRRNISRTTSVKSSSPDSYSLGLPRVVTLLIMDVRSESGEPDHQLTEVRVPLKKADMSEEGWWADAKDIAEQLQAGAARIDGPARVYTMRGKYRQFILRVTAENSDEIVSASVPVSAERTVNLIVEVLCQPGMSTRPLPRPTDKWSRVYGDRTHRPEERMDVDPNQAVPQSRKRRVSPSFDNYDSHSDHPSLGRVRRHDRGWDRSPRRRSPGPYGDRAFYASSSNQEFRSWRNSPSLDRGHRRRSYSPEYRRGASSSPPSLARHPLPTVHVGAGYPHREEEESCDLRNEPFIETVGRLLREDLEVSNDYFKANASNRLCDIVKQYEIVSRMFGKWAGKRPPGFCQPIEPIHITRALEITDPQEFISNCEETLALLKLYGKRGRVHKDPRVIEMLDDQKPSPVNSAPVQKLLRLLRAVDDARRNDRSAPLQNDIVQPETSDKFDRRGPHSPQEKSRPPVHSQMANAAQQPQAYASTSTAVAAGPEERGSVESPRYSSRGKTMFVD